MKKETTIYVRHDYNTDEPLAVGRNFEELQKKKSEWVGKQGKDRGVYDREYVMIEEGEKICDLKHCEEPHYKYCPNCGKKLPYSAEELSRS